VEEPEREEEAEGVLVEEGEAPKDREAVGEAELLHVLEEEAVMEGVSLPVPVPEGV